MPTANSVPTANSMPTANSVPTAYSVPTANSMPIHYSVQQPIHYSVPLPPSAPCPMYSKSIQDYEVYDKPYSTLTRSYPNFTTLYNIPDSSVKLESIKCECNGKFATVTCPCRQARLPCTIACHNFKNHKCENL